MRKKMVPSLPVKKTAVPALDLASIGENIARARKRLRLNQYQLAETVGVHPNYVSQLECGRKEPSLSLLARTREALCLSWEEIFRSAGEQADNGNGRKIEEFERRRMLRAAEQIKPEERDSLLHVMELFAKRLKETSVGAAASPAKRGPGRKRGPARKA